jgi:predicted RNA-binding Zn ribbon-like protein
MGTKTVADISLLGGHAVLDFVNTVDAWRDRWGPDFLATYDDLIVWAVRTGIIDGQLAQQARSMAEAEPTEADAALERARELRAALHGLGLAEADSRQSRRDDVATLNEALLRTCGKRQLEGRDDGLRWAWPEPADLDLVSDRMAVAASEFLVDRSEDRRRIRECLGRNCGWLFLDTSRGGRRRWCSDRTCGTGDRVRRFRAE